MLRPPAPLSCLLALLFVACSAGSDDAPAATDDADRPAATTADPTAVGWVDIPQGSRMVHTWVARPEGQGPFPTIVVIHQNRGISPWVRGMADRLAAEGYVAAAPDLLSGTAPGGGGTADFADADAARDGIYALDPGQVTSDLDAVSDYLAGRTDTDGRVSVAGFCWGGTQSFQFATQRPGLTAAYVFYGTGPEDASAYAEVDAPVFGFYGGADNRVNATIDASRAAMEAAGQEYAPEIYEGAGHGFMSRGDTAEDPDDPNAVAMRAAWDRWRALLARYAG